MTKIKKTSAPLPKWVSIFLTSMTIAGIIIGLWLIKTRPQREVERDASKALEQVIDYSSQK